jgi:8-oxo-dGTP pyrophosphatase MutT (NUDIX family)
MAKRIRPLALGLIEHQGHVFVSRGEDALTHLPFYRFLGGGIEFGETSQAALQREFWEELEAEITAVEYITCLDNIFTFDGKPKHELIQLFRARFADPRFYEVAQQFRFVEGDRVDKAFWLNTSRIFSGECRLVPESCLPYLTQPV